MFHPELQSQLAQRASPARWSRLARVHCPRLSKGSGTAQGARRKAAWSQKTRAQLLPLPPPLVCYSVLPRFTPVHSIRSSNGVVILPWQYAYSDCDLHVAGTTLTPMGKETRLAQLKFPQDPMWQRSIWCSCTTSHSAS